MKKFFVPNNQQRRCYIYMNNQKEFSFQYFKNDPLKNIRLNKGNNQIKAKGGSKIYPQLLRWLPLYLLASVSSHFHYKISNMNPFQIKISKISKKQQQEHQQYEQQFNRNFETLYLFFYYKMNHFSVQTEQIKLSEFSNHYCNLKLDRKLVIIDTTIARIFDDAMLKIIFTQTYCDFNEVIYQ